MKALTTGEKFDLIRYHGQSLSRTGTSIPMAKRSEVVESAQRIIDIAKGIPKMEWGIED